jgi:hypothetical protein
MAGALLGLILGPSVATTSQADWLQSAAVSQIATKKGPGDDENLALTTARLTTGGDDQKGAAILKITFAEVLSCSI